MADFRFRRVKILGNPKDGEIVIFQAGSDCYLLTKQCGIKMLDNKSPYKDNNSKKIMIFQLRGMLGLANLYSVFSRYSAQLLPIPQILWLNLEKNAENRGF